MTFRTILLQITLDNPFMLSYAYTFLQYSIFRQHENTIILF